MADPATSGASGLSLNLRGLNALILDVHRAGREMSYAGFKALMLAEIQTLIPFDSAWWGNTAAEPAEIHQLHLHNCDESILETYRPYMDQDFFRAALIAQPGVTINMADLTTRERFVRTELYKKVGKRYKIEWSLGTLLVEPVSSLYEFLTLWRHDAKKPFTEVERQTKELLMPHLAEAHRAARLREVLGEARECNQQWAVADERGFLREATPAFIHRLREHWPQWRGSRLPEALADMVRSATSYHAHGLKLGISHKGYFRYLRLQATSALDSLTPREREIAMRFAKGEAYTAIATALGLSSSTVRNHLAHCYCKLSVNNKAELALRIASWTGLS